MRGRRTLKRWENGVRGVIVGLRKKALRVAIVSCDKWRGRVYDDLLLEGEFLKRGMKAEIVSWQDTGVKWEKYNVAVVGSMWGYQNFLGEFEKWLDEVGGKTVLVNPVEVIRKNYNKAEQFRVLARGGVSVIETQVVGVGKLDEFEIPKGEFVVKPAVSGSGENTFLVRNSGDFDKVRGKLGEVNETRKLLVQPFVLEIRDGELGVVVIGGEIMNVVRRFPGVFEGGYKVEAVERGDVSSGVNELVRKVVGLPEYERAVYLRIDMVERKDGPVVMEVEAFEPQLYYYLLKGADREKMLAKMVEEVAKRGVQRKVDV